MTEAERLAREVERLFTLLVRERERSSDAEERALTSTQQLVLAAVADGGAQRLGALAEAVGVTGATASRTVESLVALGLVARNADAADRRALQIDATAEGRRLVRRRRTLLARLLDRRLSTLDPSERDRFIAVFTDLNDLLETRAPA